MEEEFPQNQIQEQTNLILFNIPPTNQTESQNAQKNINTIILVAKLQDSPSISSTFSQKNLLYKKVSQTEPRNNNKLYMTPRKNSNFDQQLNYQIQDNQDIKKNMFKKLFSVQQQQKQSQQFNTPGKSAYQQNQKNNDEHSSSNINNNKNMSTPPKNDRNIFQNFQQKQQFSTPTKTNDFQPFNQFQQQQTQKNNLNQAQNSNLFLSTPKKQYNNYLSYTDNKLNRNELNSQFTTEDLYSYSFTNDYVLKETIGQGSFGIVYKCQHKIDNQIYALKCTKKQILGEKSKKEILNEARALAKLSANSENQNVVRFYNTWIDDGQLYLAMELCKSSLKQKMQERPMGLTEQEIKIIFREICKGIKYLHTQKLVHLDIKPENILISNSNIHKLADLGLSRISSLKRGEQLEEGDSRYLAQELLNAPKERKMNLEKADIFSLGITIYQLIINEELPMHGEEWHFIRDGLLPKLVNNNSVSNKLKKLVTDMMRKDYNNRPSVQQILESDFLKDEMRKKLAWIKAEHYLLKQKLNELNTIKQNLNIEIQQNQARTKSLQ